MGLRRFAICTSMGMNRTSELSGALLSGPTDGNPLYVCQYRAAENHIGRMKGIYSGAYAFSFRLNVHQISNLGKVDKQIIIDINLDNGIKRVLNAYNIAFEVIESHSLAAWIHDPVLTNAGIIVVIEFADVIICWIAGGNNLNDEIRGAVAAFSIQFILVADNHNIRLNNCKGLVGQFYVKWGTEYLASSLFTFDVVIDDIGQFHRVARNITVSTSDPTAWIRPGFSRS